MTNFKIGDVVCVEKKPKLWDSSFGKDPMFLTYPFTGIVSKIKEDNGATIGGYGFGIEKADGFKAHIVEEKKEITSFKKGDWVAWTGYNPAIGQIHSGPEGECYVLNINGCITSHDSCHFSHLRLATEEELIAKGIKPAKEESIKVGDKVEVISLSQRGLGTDYKVGDTFTIKRLEKSIYPEVKFWIHGGEKGVIPIVNLKKINNMSTEKVIKEYKVVTTFPTATKDYQVGEIVKKGTALFKKAHKFPSFFEAVYEDNGFKAGDYVVIVKSDFTLSGSCYKIGNTYQLKAPYTPNEGNFLTVLDDRGSTTNGYTGVNYYTKIIVRAATPAEILAYKQKSSSKKVVVSNNNIELTINRNGNITVGTKNVSFTIKEVKDLQAKMAALEGLEIGPWSTALASGSDRFVRVGCAGENFRVNYQDLNTVITAYNSLQ